MRPPEPYVAPTRDRTEQALATLAAVDPLPVQGECLACFVGRAVRTAGCGGAHAWAERFAAVRAPAATGVADRLRRLGARCDGSTSGEGAVWEVAREHQERDVHTDELVVPDPLPGCGGVAAGSTRPCGLWVRGPRRPPGAHRQTCAAHPVL